MKKKIYFLSMSLNILSISTLRPECILYHKLKVVFFYVHFSTLAEFFLQKSLAWKYPSEARAFASKH